MMHLRGVPLAARFYLFNQGVTRHDIVCHKGWVCATLEVGSTREAK